MNDVVISNAGPSYPDVPAASIYVALTRCLACGGMDLRPYLGLGSQPLANAFSAASSTLPRYPLGLQRCHDCWHSQNLVAVDPDMMFRDYLYASGTTATLRRYFDQFVGQVEYAANTGVGLRILEIGSNDGSLLEAFSARGHHAVGVEPSNRAADMKDNGSATSVVRSYWNDDCLDMLRDSNLGPFDAIVAMNVLGHVDDPMGFLVRCKRVLAEGGRIYVQTSQANMILNAEFDTVYHEHLSFFTARSFRELADCCGLAIERISHADIHGTSYLVEMSTKLDPPRPIPEIEVSEYRSGLYDAALYDRFQWKADSIRDAAMATLSTYIMPGKFRMIGYGAAAKGMTFLNRLGVDERHIEMIVDDNPLKQGKRTPGGNIPVVPIEAIDDIFSPCAFIILAWNFRDEIMKRIKARREKPGDVFITFFPRVHIL